LDDIFGSTSPPTSQLETPTTTQLAAPPAKASFDDTDDDFEGLEDAKEGSADDDFATISRSGLDDFNPVFDSSPPASHATKSESNLTGTTAPFGAESSFDFASLGSSVGGGSTTGVVPSGNPTTANQNGSAGVGGGASNKPAAASESHDWDAIFASLDEPAGPGAPSGGPSGAETSGVSPSAPLPPPANSRPGTGRALTETGTHDDPILKNLTGMGYSRTEALSALEKYDYNLERVSRPPTL